MTCYKNCQPDKTKPLTPNVLLQEVKENESVNINLSCGNHSGNDVSWRHNGHLISSHGNQLHTVVKYLQGGNYTCHRADGKLLHHTLVLQAGIGFRNSILVQSASSEHITCSARNFDGKFQCSWQKTQDRSDAELFHFTVNRGAERAGNITCSMGENGNTLKCEDNAHCPYAEEPARVNLSLYFRSTYRYEVYNPKFFIFEIVKPDKLTITKVGAHNFTWANPETWSVPPCYFQLQFEVKLVHAAHSCDHHEHHGKIVFTTERSYNVVNRKLLKRGYKLCVRAKDESSNSIWSDWSFYLYNAGPQK
ncbi:interleukin-12 subunit beta [Engraulis encrasicolus]|uniref:interleukin-12 subunit beta n=1 Tax=Engraulis encrasicolus TaxID=184585 RepID=UPI002FD0A962